MPTSKDRIFISEKIVLPFADSYGLTFKDVDKEYDKHISTQWFYGAVYG